MITIETLSGEGAEKHREAVLGIWIAVFGKVENPDDWTASPWDRHRARAGYRLVIARDGDRPLGFAWGYTGERGQYWPDLVSREVGPRLDEWLGGHFEFVELAVIPAARRGGVGGRLHDALLAALPHEKALLETSARDDDPGVRLYASRGWISLASYGADRQVMGLALGAAVP